MGGARCSYRNCTVKSDNKTHMFHYPVFDKVRCHQWITNAQKMNFLDLKLSQLKNRMICEHHFTDDEFMNVMKAKLKNTAVPTEDGPFCTKPEAIQTDDSESHINLDDIENDDYLTNMEKRAHFSVKYGDFLTNDVSEPITLVPNYKATSIKLQDQGLVFNRSDRKHVSRTPQRKYKVKSILNSNVTSTKPKVNALVDKNITVPDQMSAPNENIEVSDQLSSLYQNELLPNPKVMAIEFEELNLNSNEQSNKPSLEAMLSLDPLNQVSVFSQNNKSLSGPSPSSEKVKILSEKKISEPVIIKKGKMQPVSPSLILKIPDRKKNINVEMNGVEIQTFYLDVSNTAQGENLQEFGNSSIPVSQASVTDQMCLTEFTEPNTLQYTTTVDQLDNINNSGVEIVELTDATHNNMQLKQESEQLTDLNSIMMVPNMEFVPTMSVNAPVEANSMDMPEVATHLKESNCVENITELPMDIKKVPSITTDLATLSSMPLNIENTSETPNNTNKLTGILNNTQLNFNRTLPKEPRKQSSSKSSKSKLPPEKVAAIVEKRKFNMKLRDIIDSCLNKLDEEPEETKLSPAKKKKMSSRKVGEHLASHPDLPSSQENTIAYFEARLQRMEDTLLNKIDQNSHRITDLKRTIKSASASGTKSAYTQTYTNPDTVKRHIYQQIAQFLSPEVKSLVYEELFIKNDVSPKTKSPLKKRRRR